MVNFLFVLMMIILVPGTVRCLTFTPIGTTDDKNSFECNTNVSLVCQTQNGQDIIILELNNTQLVNCVTRCFVNTPLLGKYIVTHNFDEGIIRLDIPKITNADASNEFICRGDSTSISIKPIIKVFPVNSLTELIINEMNGTNVVEIKALTGCVLLQNNLTFVWSKTRYFNGTILEPLSTEEFIIKTTYSAEDGQCIPSDHCGGEARSSTLTFTEETSGGVDFYITCTIVINENVTRNTSQTYTIISERIFTLKDDNVNDGKLDSKGCFSETVCTIGVAIAISVSIILLVVIIVCAILRKRKSVDYCPDSPTGLRLISKGETFATFTWTPGPHPEGQSKFQLCYKRLQDHESTFKETKVSGTMETIKDLQPGCMYHCYMYAMNGNRKSENSKLIDFTTLGLPDSPTKFEIIEVTESTFLLNWTPGRYCRYNQTFVIECRDTITRQQRVIKIKEKTSPSIPFIQLLESLSAGTEYHLMLYAENKIGRSARIGPIIQTTLGLPDKPTHFQAVLDTVTETTVTLTWKPGKYHKYRQTFVLSYRLKDKNNLNWADVLLKDEHKPKMLYKVDNLKEGTTYELKIHAKNDIGVSKSSNIISVETKGKTESPSELREVESERTSYSVTVSWIPGTYRRDIEKFVMNNIRTCIDGRNKKWKHKQVVDDGHSSEMRFKLDGLRAGKSFYIAINAINHIGTSAMSDTVTVKTIDNSNMASLTLAYTVVLT